MHQQSDIDEKVRELVLFLCWCTEGQRTDFFHAIFREFCRHCGSGDGYNCNCEGEESTTPRLKAGGLLDRTSREQ